MTFNHHDYLTRFLADHEKGTFSNNSVAKVDRSIFAPCYRVIGIHKLTPSENNGKHNIYIDIVDKSGNRLLDQIDWGWQGQRPGEVSRPLVLDKPAAEPGGNLVVWAGQTIWARVLNKASDMIYNVTTGLPDEGPGNTWGHHSYYVVFMYDEGGPVIPPVKPPIEPADCVELQQSYDELRATLQAVKGLLERI